MHPKIEAIIKLLDSGEIKPDEVNLKELTLQQSEELKSYFKAASQDTVCSLKFIEGQLEGFAKTAAELIDDFMDAGISEEDAYQELRDSFVGSGISEDNLNEFIARVKRLRG